jgi:NAD(P)-dependent dehydrogenase (short-subunit alcohol dehydrogenase family)
MRARRYGRIVNISSIAAIGTALPGNAFYAATKSEVAILTKRFAMELGTHKITVNYFQLTCTAFGLPPEPFGRSTTLPTCEASKTCLVTCHSI